MAKSRNRRNKRIRIDTARENLLKLNADLNDQIECRKAAEAVHPGTEPRMKGVRTRSEVRGIIATTDDFVELISKNDDGPDDESHVAEVLRDLLCFFAPYYRALLNGNFKEAAHNTVTLEMDPACCNIFTSSLIELDPAKNDHDPALRQQIPPIDRRLQHSSSTEFIAERLAPDSTREYNDALYDGIPVDFARELKTRLAPHREVPQDCACCHSPCNYHEHDNTEEWKLTSQHGVLAAILRKRRHMGSEESHSLSSTTDMIQVTAATEDDTEDDASEKSSKPFQALIDKDLCFFSTDYRAALRGGFLESRNKSVVLDLKTTDCRHLIEWLYSGRLPDVLRTTQLFSLYVFADKTDILALRRAIMTRVVEVDETMPAFFEAAVALDSLSSTSPLYRWLLDTYVHHWMSKYPTEEDMLPNQVPML
ncbi:hypothetical protein KCU91_g12479, partial [Aureobasidium melanogenum]